MGRPRVANATIDRAILAQCDRVPEAVAITSPGEEYRYDELRAAAYCVGRWAAGLPAGDRPAERLVAVDLDREASFLPAVLGCWLAGLAVVPLDPQLPDRRLDYVLQDSEALAVLTSAERRGRFARFAAGPVADFDDLVAGYGPPVPPQATPASPAYAIYTSGSTGRPKGILVLHEHLANYVAAVAGEVEFGPDWQWAVFSSFATDLALTALLPSAASGGTTHVLSRELALDPHLLAAYVAARGINSIKIAPSHLRALLEAPRWAAPVSQAVLGGEVLRWELVRAMRRAAPECRVFNSYGPAETTVAVAMHECRDDGSGPGTALVPVGRPLAGSQLLVLDEELQPYRRGNVGEIYIGGRQVSAGYIGAAASRSDAAFLHHVPPGMPGPLYRTGDLGRQLPDGTFEVVGRSDGQVKIRGHRVELGEIAAAARAVAGVSDACAVARHDEQAVGDIVLFAVTGAAPVPVDAIMRHLEAHLPPYMVPARIDLLDELPRLASGKPNVKELEKLARSGGARNGRRPESNGEAADGTLATTLSIFRDLLQVPRFGPTDDFYLHGGHSLLAVRAAQALAGALGRPVPVAMLLLHPTPASLADALDGGSSQPSQA